MLKGKYTKEHEKEKIPLKFKFFKLEVLDRYKENPIYTFSEHGVSLSLGIKDEYYRSPDIAEEDKIEIQSLGYAYRKKDNSKVVVTYLPYLAKLSKKHQDYWASFEEDGECIIDSDFFDQEIKAEFTDRANIFDAFLQELAEINKICVMANRPNLFKSDYSGNKPSNFSWPTKLTSKSYNELVHLFDKLISENINRNFFDGKIEFMENNIQKGTLRLLEEFLRKFFRFPDQKPQEDMLKHFKLIRNERQKPAHKIEENKYDPGYYEKIKKLVTASYRSIRTLRLIFTNFPGVRNNYQPPSWLQRGKIM